MNSQKGTSLSEHVATHARLATARHPRPAGGRSPPARAGPGRGLLQMASVGVCGSDVHYYLHGRIGTQVVTAPIIIGHEFSAWIAGLGEAWRAWNRPVGHRRTWHPLW